MKAEYRGWKLERVDVSAQTGPSSYAAMGRGDFGGRWRKESSWQIYSPDDLTRPVKSVASRKAAIEYINNYMGWS